MKIRSLFCVKAKMWTFFNSEQLSCENNEVLLKILNLNLRFSICLTFTQSKQNNKMKLFFSFFRFTRSIEIGKMTEGISESFCFYIFGIACLTPWNFFITPQSYWNTKFADNTSNGIDENEMQKFWDSSLSGNSYTVKIKKSGKGVVLWCSRDSLSYV